MRHALLLLLLAFSPLAAAADRPALADKVATAAGIETWSRLATLRFTFRVIPRDMVRTHAWDIASGTVEVTNAGATRSIPTAGVVDAADAERAGAHQAFVNDSYWLLFCLHVRWDDATLTDLGRVAVPQLPDLGERPALAVQYPTQGGYTPGDRYVLYLGDDHLPVAWAFHKAAAEAPSLVVRWLDWKDLHGVKVPTRFTTPDGKDFIRFEDVAATTR